MKKQYFGILMLMCIVFIMLSPTVLAEAATIVGDFIVTGGTLNTDYTYDIT